MHDEEPYCDYRVTGRVELDKVTALLKLGQHLGLFPTKVEHGGRDGGAVPIQIVGIEIAED